MVRTSTTWVGAALGCLVAAQAAAQEHTPPAQSAAPVAVSVAAPVAAPAAAADPVEAGATGLRLHHPPRATAAAHEPLGMYAQIEHPELLREAVIAYRAPGEKSYHEARLLRAAEDPDREAPGQAYRATLPAEALQPPGIEYAIELVATDGQRIAAFASRREPQPVQVPEAGMDAIHRATSRRLDDRHSVLSAMGEYVSFGNSAATVRDPSGGRIAVPDRYYRVEGSYTYRLLRVVSEFGIAVGVLRGTAPIASPAPADNPDEPLAPYAVGLNYGRASVRFRFHEWWSFEPSALVNVTQQGFSAGTGATLHIGDPYGTKLLLGFEAIQHFGVRVFSEVDVQVHRHVRISPIVEVTNMPSAEDFGVRLLGEVGVDMGHGFGAVARGGYQARVAASGGATLGGVVNYAF